MSLEFHQGENLLFLLEIDIYKNCLLVIVFSQQIGTVDWAVHKGGRGGGGGEDTMQY